ncbi:MAG: glycosyltransferase family 2 protein [Clostridiales bacterium]|nr:glycosyltransferase family 2 protein [Clostridiales bacterium]
MIDNCNNVNMVEPLVSIIVPAYNCEKTISETIESVICQSYKNWEMIIVNDCSTDNSTEIIETYVKKDIRIKLYNHEMNSGSAAARNTAIKYASGRFIAMLDSDDLWKKDKLSKQISFMIQNNYAFTFTSYETFHDTSDSKRKVFSVPQSINYKQYLKNTIIGNLSVIIDISVIQDFHIVSGNLEDVLTWMYFLNKGYVAYGLNENLASYRVARESKSGNKFKNAKRYYECLKQQPITAFDRIIDEFCYLFNATKKRLFSKSVTYSFDNEGITK